MQTNNPLLEQLRDIQLPDPVGWWPLAFSWWILLFSIIAIITGAIWYYLDLRRRNIYRRSALQQIDEIMQKTDMSDNVKISAINAVLKRVALTAYGRLITASLHDQAWLDFLSETASYIPQPDHLQDVLNFAYKPSSEDKIDFTQSNLSPNRALEIWRDYAKKWIKGHHQ
ncbi:DUF4381 domain-containing protein [Thiomicrorhabdus sp. Milos-T2]|uniref:DUF4381 domain-containing protein n=1 Tax=Thiomicrorhabdus sp. Milos-T2 TaxID=90814 RepID=UPI00049456FD|nr:DUF4381 domain-containing protein [Thiomicrorhabdus sp. Milos-T2]